MWDKYFKALGTDNNTIRRNKLLFVLGIIAVSVMLIINFYALFRSMKQNILSVEEQAVNQVGIDLNGSLIEAVDAIEITSYTIELMLSEGKNVDDIQEYIDELSEVYSTAIDGQFDFVYGVIDGNFLSGIDFDPGDDYVPENRDWYKAAVAEKGDIAYVTPYIDKYTGKRMMSISKMLRDGESVISVDVNLDRIQSTTVEQAAKYKGSYSMVVDSKGIVVAHSAESNIGKNYLSDNGTFGNNVVKMAFETDDRYFEITNNGVKYIVFTSTIGDDWHILTVINEGELFVKLNSLYLVFFIVLALFIVVATAIFININKKHEESENLNILLRSVSGIYAIVYLIDMNFDTYEEIVSTDSVRQLLGNDQNHAMDTLKIVMDIKAGEMSKRNINEFIDHTTLEERLAVTGTITQEFLDDRNMWCRGRFVAVDYNEDNTLHRVLWMVEVIDEEKRQSDKLLVLSETDRMTGILNRGGGEAKIREMLEDGRSGMFCLMDADKFKSINDNYGHGVGDKVLIAIADCLKKSFRGNDIVLRLGGDEFAAYAPTVLNEQVARGIIDRFFDNINQIKIPELIDHPIYISMGVAFYKPEDNYSFDELYKRADHGTYLSKKHEGNYVVFEGEDN